MKLYHGSDKIITKPIYGYGRRDCDYGSGFYLCPEKEIAWLWASQYVDGGYINEYEINTNELKVLNLGHTNNNEILKWITLLCSNRVDQGTLRNNQQAISFLLNNFLVDLNDVDIVVGYRADDSYYQYTRAFLNDDLSIELLKKAMESGNLGMQYALISKKAFEKIQFIKSYKITHSDDYKKVEEQSNNEFNKILLERDINQTYLRDIVREISESKRNKK